MSIMKKFNSFFESAKAMTILAIAAIALTSVFGFTSCDKNNDSFNEPVQPTTFNCPQKPTNNKADSNYQLFLSNEVLDLGDVVVRVEGENTEYKASEAPSTSTTMKFQVLDKTYEETFNGRTITVNNVKPGAKVTAEFIPNKEAIAALPADGTTNMAVARYITGGENDKRENPTKGIINSKVESLLTRRVANFSHAFSN